MTARSPGRQAGYILCPPGCGGGALCDDGLSRSSGEALLHLLCQPRGVFGAGALGNL